MKIFIEGSPLFVQRSGVGQYTKRLLDGAIARDTKDAFTVFGFLLAWKKRPTGLLKPAGNLHFRYIRYFPGKVYRGLFQFLIAPPVDLLMAARADVVLFPNFVRWPLAFSKKSIVIVYDLSYINTSEHSASRLRNYLSRFVPKSIEQSDHVITISENSKKEIIDHYRVDPNKITIISPAVDHKIFTKQAPETVDSVLKKYDIGGKYILFTGTIEPRKNIIGILNAYAALPETIRSTFSLVLVGGKGWLDESIHRRLEELKKLNIILTGYAPDEDLPGLYSGASVFIYPSFYEGFGMPPLEAMACGVPVITSNNSSLPEVVGGAGLMVEANDQSGLTNAIKTVLTDNNLAAELAQKGLVQAKKFNWDSSAVKLLEVIGAVAKS